MAIASDLAIVAQAAALPDGGKTTVVTFEADQAEEVHQINIHLAGRAPFVFASTDEPLRRLLEDLVPPRWS